MSRLTIGTMAGSMLVAVLLKALLASVSGDACPPVSVTKSLGATARRNRHRTGQEVVER